MATTERIREIPYNYTSFSDREIVMRYLGASYWALLNDLRESRRTGRSARLLFEILGDMWVVSRNPFIQDDLLTNQKRRQSLTQTLNNRLDQIVAWAEGNEQALQLANRARQAVEKFETELTQMGNMRQRVARKLEQVTRKDNIDFSGLGRVSHVTDASDWRVEYPLVVIYPQSEQQVMAVVQCLLELELVIIPRGGGTGYTGGAVPLQSNSAVINLEKLDSLGPVYKQNLPHLNHDVAVIQAEAGVVTKRVAEKAGEQGLVFAVDPTSQDASTIGGNVAMNAGGKKAVLWGTTLDNLLSWRMVTPDAQWLDVERLNHHLGKIHDTDIAVFRLRRYDASRSRKLDEQLLEIPGPSLRKQGLGKDVTDKFLGGLPGIQKEGCDGIITSANFVLHRQPLHIRTVCLEFFGNDLRRAVPAIVECKTLVDTCADVLMAGMEHLDERYVKAVNYATKAARSESPKMVLLIDVVSDDENILAQIAADIIRRANARGAEGFVAVSSQARQRFWADRARTAAIAAHTNAFKINEDVVIPLPKLAEYSEGIERINIEQSLKNKLAIIDAVADFFRSGLNQVAPHISDENDIIFRDKKSHVLSLLANCKEDWQFILNHLDNAGAAHLDLLDDAAKSALQKNETLFQLLQRRALRISYRRSLERPINDTFSGQQWQPLRDALDAIHKRILSSRLFVALHMHAGDGNVHSNIPVNSNDYAMMQEADVIVERIMKLATTLGGVISGEHGIGITKMHFLEEHYVQAFADYKNRVDPGHRFNRGKLTRDGGLQNAYTPSLRLVQQEAIILEASALGKLNDSIKHCLRCGKCKPVCTTHVPRANLLYSPRNKILASGLIIEAFLYEEQTRRGLSARHFQEMNDVADHCTVCHRCLPPCPVNIDFGDVSMHMRQILKEKHKKTSNVGTKLSMAYLNATDPATVKVMRRGLLIWGFKLQNLAYKLAKKLVPSSNAAPKSTTGKPSLSTQVLHFVKKPLPDAIPSKTTRALLGIEDRYSISILRDPKKISDDTDAVFYFPGCGSERLFSQVGLATLAMLYTQNTQTVLPPGYLCCGYPQKSNGDADKAMQISTDNRVLFHRVANTLAYLNITTVLVSCGTCLDQLEAYQFDKIFPGCRLMDIHEYLMEKGVRMPAQHQVKYLYHDPCHTPMKQHDPIAVCQQLLGHEVILSDRCCGEAGTFAVSRPDIATQVRFRKQEELHQGIEKLTGERLAQQGNVKLLTSCPACQQGLSRYRDETGLQTDYIVVELAEHILGRHWQTRFVESAKQGGIERIMF